MPSDYIFLGDLQIAKVEGEPGSQSPIAPLSISLPNSSRTGDFTIFAATSSGASYYTLEERDVNKSSWNNISNRADFPKNIASHPKGTYQYRVKACNRSGCSQFRESQTITIEGSGSSVPTTPSGLMSPRIDSDGKYSVSWDASVGASTYEIRQKTGAGNWVSKQNSSARIYNAHTLLGTSYFSVRACNSKGCSAYSPSTVTTVMTGPRPCFGKQLCNIRR